MNNIYINSRCYREFYVLKGGYALDLKGEKSLDLNIENLKLEETVKIIREEIVNYISKRQNISQYIIDYRKKVIEEFKDDEDKIAEYFDHERFVKEEAFKNIDRRLKELTVLQESPYFGRVEFIDKEYEDEEKLYIGRFGVTPEGSYEPTVVDWRAPVASLFYKGTLGKASYVSPQGNVDVDITGRRQYIIKKAKLKGMFDSEIDVKDEILQLVLSANSDEKLKDIIMTLQKEQDDIIRQPRENTLVVNGVAGSGKTTIALHRVAYLLYNYRDILKDKVLIIGPNNIFMEYISSVLPSLGESGVKQSTFTNFALDILDIEEVMTFKEYSEKILSDDKAFIKEAEYKNSDEYVQRLDEMLKEMDDSYFKYRPVHFEGNIVVDLEEIDELFNKHYAHMPLFRRNEKVKRILVSKLKDRRDEEVRKLKAEIKAYRESLSPDELKQQENNIEFKRKMRIREIIREVMNQRDIINKWITPQSIEDIYNEFNQHKPLTIDDLAPILYLMLKLTGIKNKDSIKHVVIDEAQDFSKLQFKVIKEITGAVSLTIVGDANQRLTKTQDRPAMLDVESLFPDLKVMNFNLNKSYRSTYEIMEHANKYLKEDKIVPMVRSGAKVESIIVNNILDLGNIVAQQLNNFKEQGLENIAIITKTMEELNEVESTIKSKSYVATLKSEDMLYNGGIVMLPSYFAKGLEFDGVIILDNEDIKTNDFIKYIMCTRALHGLMEIKY